MMFSTSSLFFWISLLFLAYTLVGYSALLSLVARIWSRKHSRGEIWPRVTVIIPAHNSQKLIKEKLDNTLQLEYPTDKFHIVVASDSSTDDTDEIVRSYAGRGVQLVRVAERRGKHHVQRVAIGRTSGEIIIFTDAAVRLEPNAARQIVSNFFDDSVGCVSSEDRLLPQHSDTGEGTYVPSEMRLRRLEAQVSSLVGVSGSFFAARRSVCDPWHSDQSSDFFVPLHTVSKGLRAVVDPDSVAYFGAVPSPKSEFDRKVRTIVHGLVVFFDHLYLLDPLRYGWFSLQLISHKGFRWLLPYAMLGLLISNALLLHNNVAFKVFLALQLLGYLGALLALNVHWFNQFKVLKVSAFLVLSCWATVVAWFTFLSGDKLVTWEPSRR